MASLPLLLGVTRDIRAFCDVLDSVNTVSRLRAELGDAWCGTTTARADAVSSDILGGAPCDGLRWSNREVRYSLCETDCRSALDGVVTAPSLPSPPPASCAGGVRGRGLASPDGSSLAGDDDWPPLTVEPRRDRNGDAVLASTPPVVVLVVLVVLGGLVVAQVEMDLALGRLDLVDGGVEKERVRCDDDLLRLLTSTWERLRFRLDWEAFFLRLDEDGSRDSLTSDADRPWAAAARAAASWAARSGDGDVRLRSGLVAGWWCLCSALDEGTRRPRPPPTTCFCCFARAGCCCCCWCCCCCSCCWWPLSLACESLLSWWLEAGRC